MSDPSGHASASGVATQEDKTWALLAHIGSLVSAWFAFGFIAPLVVMLVKQDRPFVRRHAVESLNFQLSLLLYSVAGVVVAFFVVVLTLGVGLLVVLPVVLVIALLALVFIVRATMRAGNGEDYRYPLSLRFIS